MITFVDPSARALPDGINVTIAQGTTTIGTGTTDVSGSVSITVSQGQTYTATFSGTSAPTTSQTFVGGSNQNALAADDGSGLETGSGNPLVTSTPTTMVIVAGYTSPAVAEARVTLVSMEALADSQTNARATQVSAEALVTSLTLARVTQVAVEVLLPAPASVVSITVSPQNIAMAFAQHQQFTAIATYDTGATFDATNQVVWAASEGEISGTGLFQSGPTNNDTAITATYAQPGFPTIVGTSNVLVSDDVIAQPTFNYLRAEEFVWAVLIYDTSGRLVDIPQDDVASIQVEDVVNGGSGAGTFVFRRPFNTIGALGFRYLFQLFIWQKGTVRPVDPVWSGHFVDFEQKELDTTGEITALCDGDFALLNDQLINVNIDPNDGTNPGLDAASFISGLLSNYQSSNKFGTPLVPSTMFPLEPTNFQDVKLGDALDTITKIGRNDTTGQLFVWSVRTKGDLSRRVVVQADPNPNVETAVAFIHLFKDAQLVNYDVQTKYRDVYNVVAVYGGQDSNGQQVYGVYQDTASIAALNATIEGTLSNSAIRSTAAAQAYARNQLDLHSSPTAAGSFDLLTPNPKLLAGTWAQIWETPLIPSAEATIKQVRIATVQFSIKGDRITQTCSLQSPVPYLDDAIYRLGLNVDVQAAILNSENPANKQQLYIRAGGYVTATSSVPAEIQTAPVEAVFQNVGLVSQVGFGLAALIDNAGGVSEGQTGDGNYTLSITTVGTYVITKGAPPANSDLQQNLVSIWVQDGVPYCTDARTLISGMPSDPALDAPSLFPGTTVKFIAPASSGGGTYQQRIQFELLTPPASSPWLAHFVLEAIACDADGIPLQDATGSAPTPTRSVDFDPAYGTYKIDYSNGREPRRNDDGSTIVGSFYDVTINLGSGAYYQLQIRSIDQHARASDALVLGNTANNPILLAALSTTPPNAKITAIASFQTNVYNKLLTIDATFALSYTNQGDGRWIDDISIYVYRYDPSNPGKLQLVTTIPVTGGAPASESCAINGLPANYSTSTYDYAYGFVVRAIAADGSSIECNSNICVADANGNLVTP